MKEFSYDDAGNLIFEPGDSFYVPVTSPHPPLQLRVISRHCGRRRGVVHYRYLVEQLGQVGWIGDDEIWFLGKVPIVLPGTFKAGG